MTSIFSFRCSCCNEIHEGSPSFSFDCPIQYAWLTDTEKVDAHLGTDLCVINEERFIRVCLEIPIIGIKQPFMWGVWVSLSDTNFERYKVTYEDESNEGEEYFGWLSNRLPFYPDTLNLKTLALPRSGEIRPSLDIEPTEHPLSMDFHDGISVARAQEIAEFVMHGN